MLFRLYFEAVGENDLKRLKSDSIINNENIENRKKFIRLFLNHQLECEPFLNTARIVYLKRTFEVKSENVIMFKFSNNSIQVRQTDLDKILLVAGEEIILITLSNGKESNKIVCTKEDYIECLDKDLIHLYLKFKKISSQMARK